MDSLKELESYLAPRREIFKQNRESMIKKFTKYGKKPEWNPMEAKDEFDKVAKALKEIDSLEARRNETRKAAAEINQILKDISGKKFALLPKDFVYKERCYTFQEHSDSLIVDKGKATMSFPVASHFLSCIQIKGTVTDDKAVITRVTVPIDGEHRDIPVSETAMLFDFKKITKMAKETSQTKEGEHGATGRFDFLTTPCYVLVLQ